MEHNPRTDRKTIEKNRRNHMKDLCSKLHSLVPHHHTSREAMSLADHLGEASNYIKNLEKHLEKMRQKRDRLTGIAKQNIASMSCAANVGLRPPQVEVHEMGSALEVVLVTGLNYKFMFKETIRLLHEEGAEIVNAGFSVVDDTVFHTIHSKVGESGLGSGAARISERLKKFAHDAS
ncbi:Transcription factor bHLH36 like [Actinidia chinensis var. chinensis]|uniref:Transcription factor bHLH36 like n=1 Tax=Actinidia chinensis var. chinensis TaxID=1590841 RepID=A0A2R6RAQ0_ACTCC|nr:Transcription factor bHLH36 like [Actinidia chinensis var. chinensis]